MGRPGDYVFIVSYFTDDNERMQELGVDVVGTSDEDPAVLRIANCPYSLVVWCGRWWCDVVIGGVVIDGEV